VVALAYSLVACNLLEKEQIDNFVRCILPWKSARTPEHLSTTTPCLALIKFRADTQASELVFFFGETVFSDAFARLFKLPSSALVLELASSILKEYSAADVGEVLLHVPECVIAPFDEVLSAMTAVLAIGGKKPIAEGRKAARDIFSPEQIPTPSDNLKSMVTSARSSKSWCDMIDDYWATASKEEGIQGEFAAVEQLVAKSDLSPDDAVASLAKVGDLP
jgi:hypothetical protein